MPGEPFQYQPLKREKKEIRLLEILPSKNHETQLNCHLRPASLDDNADYDALSYLWGSPALDHQVFVRGDILGITRNAFHALKDLRLEDKPLIIWIDGICIDQTNIDERSHQVRLMRDVYLKAKNVRIWLDQDFDLTSPVFEAMRDMQRHGCRLGSCEEHGNQDLDFWEPALNVLREPYWERVWVQQELLLASKIMLNCRRASSDAETWLYLQTQICGAFYGLFSEGKMLEITTTLRHRYLDYPMVHTLRGTVYDAREFLQESRSKELKTYEVLLDLFYQAYPLKATNDKDKLYGLLGFLEPLPETLVIDYKLSTTQVYCQIFRLTIEQGKCLEFLCYNPTTEKAFPSWFPNLGRLGSSHWDFESTQSACGNTHAVGDIDSTGKLLRTKGFRVDKVIFKTNQDLVQEPGIMWIDELADLGAKALQHENRELGNIDETVSRLIFWWSRYSYPTIPILSASSLGGLNLDTQEQERIGWAKLSSALKKQPDLTLADLVRGSSTPDQTTLLAEIPGFQYIAVTLFLKSFIFTQTGGVLGLAHESVQLGDEIWILFGCRLPVVLRPRNDRSGEYMFISPAIIPILAEGKACVGIREDGGVMPGYDGPPIQTIEIS